MPIYTSVRFCNDVRFSGRIYRVVNLDGTIMGGGWGGGGGGGDISTLVAPARHFQKPGNNETGVASTA